MGRRENLSLAPSSLSAWMLHFYFPTSPPLPFFSDFLGWAPGLWKHHLLYCPFSLWEVPSFVVKLFATTSLSPCHSLQSPSVLNSIFLLRPWQIGWFYWDKTRNEKIQESHLRYLEKGGWKCSENFHLIVHESRIIILSFIDFYRNIARS